MAWSLLSPSTDTGRVGRWEGSPGLALRPAPAPPPLPGKWGRGRNIPRPVQALLRLVHVEQIDINKVKRDDVDVAEYLKASNPELYKTLKKEARAKRKER